MRFRMCVALALRIARAVRLKRVSCMGRLARVRAVLYGARGVARVAVVDQVQRPDRTAGVLQEPQPVLEWTEQSQTRRCAIGLI